MKEFTQKEVAKLLKIKPQTVAFYANQEIIIPDIDNPKGRGTTRKYSRGNLFEILLVKKLSECGLSLKKIKRVIDIVKTIKYMYIFSKSWINFRFFIYISNDHSSEMDVSFWRWSNKVNYFEQENMGINVKKLLIVDVSLIIKRVLEI